MFNWLMHVIGAQPRSPSTTYNFWSGFGSDIAEFAIVGGVWHQVVCHEDHCYRPGKYVTMEENGHHFRRCRKHHDARHTV